MNEDSFDLDLEQIVEYFHRVWESAILVAALELDLFSELHDGPRSAEDIAANLNIDEKGVRIVLDALCPPDFINKRDELYELTPMSAKYLDHKSKHYPGPIHWGAVNPGKWTALGNLAQAVREGKPVVERSGDPGEFFRKLTKAIAYTSSSTVPVLAQHLGIGKENKGWSMLDVACGTGDYGLKLMEYDESAHLTLSDLPAVLDQARDLLQNKNLLKRISWLPGSVFDVEYPPASFDLILLSHFLHSISKQTCAEVIFRLCAAQKPGGYLAVHEFIPDENRHERRFPLLFAMNMYIGNGVGDAYTFSEIKVWLDAAGYEDITFLDMPGRSSFVIGRKG